MTVRRSEEYKRRCIGLSVVLFGQDVVQECRNGFFLSLVVWKSLVFGGLVLAIVIEAGDVQSMAPPCIRHDHMSNKHIHATSKLHKDNHLRQGQHDRQCRL